MYSDKVEAIVKHFANAIGETVVGYETAELLLNDDNWIPWEDLPIRLRTSANKVISISWSGFDELWLATDCSLPFSVAGQTVRWVENSIDSLKPIIGKTIQSVYLGRGQFSLEGKGIEIWTRLLMQLDKGWLEIWNNLDENGYDFHPSKPDGQFIHCL